MAFAQFPKTNSKFARRACTKRKPERLSPNLPPFFQWRTNAVSGNGSVNFHGSRILGILVFWDDSDDEKKTPRKICHQNGWLGSFLAKKKSSPKLSNAGEGRFRFNSGGCELVLPPKNSGKTPGLHVPWGFFSWIFVTGDLEKKHLLTTLNLYSWDISYLGGGFKYFLFSPLFREDSHFD